MKRKFLALLVALCATTALWASNTITYTAKEKLTRSTLNVGETTFGSRITSHTFSNGTGTITCDGEVTTIGNNAFYNCSALTSITIPNSVTTIGNCAFEYCSSLTSITIPDSVTAIGEVAFFGCKGLTSVTIGNSVTTIGYGAFLDCSSLIKTNYTGTIAAWCKINFSGYSNPIQNSHNFFINNVELKDLVIPEGVDKIGGYAFESCSGFTSVTIPNSVITIGYRAFAYCDGLTSIDVDAANTHYASMDGVLFNYAKKTLIQYPIGNPRTEYTIPNSVTEIGEYAFSSCSGLTYITCEATTPPTCLYQCFVYVDKSIPLYVPAGSIETYQVAKKWEDFTDVRPITAQEVEVTEIEAEPTESAVEIAWPSVVNAETYTIEIRLGDQLICSIVFNAQGQLVSINFNLAPGRGGHTYATTAENTATGWAYTIAGLNPGTKYTYSVIAKNANEQVIDTKSGFFTTKGATAIENVSADVNTTKFLHNGQVIIRKNNKTYNTLGQEVK